MFSESGLWIARDLAGSGFVALDFLGLKCN